MITHVVLFRLKDRSAENIDKAKKVLEGLSGMVPVLRHLEVGVDLIKSERSYDIALTAKFDSLEDLEAYQNHPFHLEVAGYMAGVRESAIAVDYES
ncbi:MAG TPA: Dabb family protein [Thermodesulfobacteriota bacterium]|nr:Dabb family protein [Thermodesulfobacteriota bacterium]